MSYVGGSVPLWSRKQTVRGCRYNGAEEASRIARKIGYVLQISKYIQNRRSRVLKSISKHGKKKARKTSGMLKWNLKYWYELMGFSYTCTDMERVIFHVFVCIMYMCTLICTLGCVSI